MGAKHWAARALRNSKVKNKFPCYWALSSESPWSILKLSDISSVFSQVLQAIPLVIIVAFHLPLKIATMTPTRAIVPLPIKELGGTTAAIIQTWMVCISIVRWILKEWHGTTGRIPTTLSRDPRWRFVQRTSNKQCHECEEWIISYILHKQCHVAHVTLESNLINKLRVLLLKFLGTVSKCFTSTAQLP